MAGFALGLIETVGLTAAVEAADAAVKSANVRLVGYELTRGRGLVTVKILGEVGAVNAAVHAGCTAAGRVNKVHSMLVIPRPHDDIDTMINSSGLVGGKKKKPETKAEPDSGSKEDLKKNGKTADFDICNLCNDPLCPRKKGELRTLCIHYNNDNE